MKTRRPNRSLRLPRYAAAAVAATASPALPAAIIHVTASFNVNTPFTPVSWDIDGGGATDFRFYNDASIGAHYISAVRQPVSNAANAWVGGTNDLQLTSLPVNFAIGPGGGFQNSTHALFTLNRAAYGGLHLGTEYVGFKFLITGQQHYGWANITLGDNSLTFNDWAYESTANTAIPAGATVAVPEPAQSAAGLGLLALGTAGVAAFKRRAIAV